MYGAQNQDVFRWPTIVNGTYKQNLGTFIITLLMPGIPMLEWGEEQAYYVLDNTADNYVFGRQPMSTATAWQDHGCYSVGNAKFSTWPQESAAFGCMDDWNSIDHRDPSHPIRNIMRNMFEMRTRYPVLNDGFYVNTLSKQTHPIYLPGSLGTATETGMWSVLRSRWEGIRLCCSAMIHQTYLEMQVSRICPVKGREIRVYGFSTKTRALSRRTTSTAQTILRL